MNAAAREVRIRAGAASRFANVSLLLRTGGCDAIDLHPRLRLISLNQSCTPETTKARAVRTKDGQSLGRKNVAEFTGV